MFSIFCAFETEKQFMMNLLPERNNFDEEERKRWAINNAATFLMFLDDIQISNGNVEAMRVDVESMEERVKGLESFIRIYLKCGSISSR